jgi:hypothetical protein
VHSPAQCLEHARSEICGYRRNRHYQYGMVNAAANRAKVVRFPFLINPPLVRFHGLGTPMHESASALQRRIAKKRQRGIRENTEVLRAWYVNSAPDW